MQKRIHKCLGVKGFIYSFEQRPFLTKSWPVTSPQKNSAPNVSLGYLFKSRPTTNVLALFPTGFPPSENPTRPKQDLKLCKCLVLLSLTQFNGDMQWWWTVHYDVTTMIKLLKQRLLWGLTPWVSFSSLINKFYYTENKYTHDVNSNSRFAHSFTINFMKRSKNDSCTNLKVTSGISRYR